jgi:hypothetical protein
MGQKQTRTKFNVGASLLRLEKRYEELLLKAAKEETVPSEYIVCARDDKVIRDWVPIGQVICDNAADPIPILSRYCRELVHVASVGSRVFASIQRQDIEYAIENIDSFYKYVYESVFEQPPDEESLRRAISILQLEGVDLDLNTIKQQYRKRSFACHPDRQREKTGAEQKAAAEEYNQVQEAYTRLLVSGGIRKEGSSWYESLGGRERTEFVGPVKLLSLKEASSLGTTGQDFGAVIGLEPSIVETFVARSRSAT